MNRNSQQLDAVVIGAGQAGLAAGYHLARAKLRFEILEQAPRVGEAWRRRWDSLHLFTPAQHDGLPGLPFPAARNSYPGKDEFAAYLENYASHFGLPVRTGVRVDGVTAAGSGFAVDTASGTVRARNVIVAAGANVLPRIPDAAAGLDPGISQLHSSQYRGPADVPDGEVLVVGAGTSGAEIALELSAGHRVLLAGRPTPHIPDPLLRYAGGAYWQFIHSVLTLRTPAGRKVAATFHQRGAPLIRISPKDLDRAGVVRMPRFTGTAYRPDLGWVHGPERAPSGWPQTRRGVVPGVPGLYFVGLPFQYALTSGLIGGVGRDAEYVVRQLARRVPQPSVVAAVPEPRNGDREDGGSGEAEHAGGAHAGP